MNYTILTTLNVHNTDSIELLTIEQEEKLSEFSYDLDTNYIITLNNKHYLTTIREAIEMLSIKDGCDLVKFDNGSIGFVAYYNGISEEENSFSIAYDYLTDYTWSRSDGTITVYWEDLSWSYVVDDVIKATEIINDCIENWYNTEEYPEYESICVGDLIELKFKENIIDYKGE